MVIITVDEQITILKEECAMDKHNIKQLLNMYDVDTVSLLRKWRKELANKNAEIKKLQYFKKLKKEILLKYPNIKGGIWDGTD